MPNTSFAAVDYEALASSEAGRANYPMLHGSDPAAAVYYGTAPVEEVIQRPEPVVPTAPAVLETLPEGSIRVSNNVSRTKDVDGITYVERGGLSAITWVRGSRPSVDYHRSLDTDLLQEEVNKDASVGLSPRHIHLAVAPSSYEEGSLSRWNHNTTFMFRSDCPWYLEDFLSNHADRMFEILPRPSQKVPGHVAYFLSVEKRARNILTTSKPGKFLKKFFGDVLSEEQIHTLALKWHNRYAPRKLELATTADQIETLYRAAYLGSCIHYKNGGWSGTQHPARVFAGPDLAQAYIGEITQPDARCLVWPEKKLYYPKFYGDGPRMETALEAAGYRRGSQMDFDGARLQRSKIPNSNRFDLPYLDTSEYVRDEGDYLVIDGDGPIFARNTCGTSGPVLECADCGETLRHGEHTTIWEGHHVCESCREDGYFRCEGGEGWTPNDERASLGEDLEDSYGPCSDYFAQRLVNRGTWFVCPVDSLYHSLTCSVIVDGVRYYEANAPEPEEAEQEDEAA